MISLIFGITCSLLCLTCSFSLQKEQLSSRQLRHNEKQTLYNHLALNTHRIVLLSKLTSDNHNPIFRKVHSLSRIHALKYFHAININPHQPFQTEKSWPITFITNTPANNVHIKSSISSTFVRNKLHNSESVHSVRRRTKLQKETHHLIQTSTHLNHVTKSRIYSFLKSKYNARHLHLLSRMGLNFDECTTDADCQGTRVCDQISGDSFIPCPTGATNCLCGPTDDFSCTKSSDCDSAEICVVIIGTTDPICVSPDIAIEQSASPGIGSNPIPTSDGQDGGLNFDECTTNDDCLGSRECLDLIDDSFVTCPTDSVDCLCFPPGDFSCTSDGDCVIGEICVTVEGVQDPSCVSEASGIGEPISAGPVPTPPSDDQSGGLNFDECTSNDDCIGARDCLELEDGSFGNCPSGSLNCLCIPLSDFSCTSDSDCVIGEICVTVEGVDDPGCVSEASGIGEPVQ